MIQRTWNAITFMTGLSAPDIGGQPCPFPARCWCNQDFLQKTAHFRIDRIVFERLLTQKIDNLSFDRSHSFWTDEKSLDRSLLVLTVYFWDIRFSLISTVHFCLIWIFKSENIPVNTKTWLNFKNALYACIEPLVWRLCGWVFR